MRIKKILAYIGCAVATWGGMWLVFLGKVTNSAKEAGLYILGAAIVFIIAIILAGYGNSLEWKEEE